MIRVAKQSDRDEVIELLRLSHENAGYEFPFIPAYASRLFHYHTAVGHSVCFVLDLKGIKGILMASVMDHPFGAGLFAKETVWFIHENHRGGKYAPKMLKEYEKWAKERGCRMIGMASLSGIDMSKFYRRQGYEVAETHYMKAI